MVRITQTRDDDTKQQEPHFIPNQKPNLQALTLPHLHCTAWHCDLRKGIYCIHISNIYLGDSYVIKKHDDII